MRPVSDEIPTELFEFTARDIEVSLTWATGALCGASSGTPTNYLSKQKMSAPGTRKKLLSILEDVEIVSK